MITTIIETLMDNGIEAVYKSVTKNGVKRDAIMVITDENINPIFYFNDTTNVDEFVENVVNHMKRGIIPEVDPEKLLKLDFFKQNARVCVRPIRNIEEDVAKATKYEGIEMYIRVSVFKDATFVLRKDMLSKYGITEDESFEIAMDNTLPEIRIEDMAEIMAEMAGITTEELLNEIENIPRQIVVTNNTKTNGASAILFDSVIEDVKKRLGCDKLLLLPSSIHECILGDAETMSIDDASEMVAEINATEVVPEEKLSDIAYLV